MKSAAQTFVNDAHGHSLPVRDVLLRHPRRLPRARRPTCRSPRSPQGTSPVLDLHQRVACQSEAAPPTAPTGTRVCSKYAQSTASFNVVLMLTDGNPTVLESKWDRRARHGVPPSAQVVRGAGVEEAVASANAVKQEGAHVISIGIGSNLPVDNLARDLGTWWTRSSPTSTNSRPSSNSLRDCRVSRQRHDRQGGAAARHAGVQPRGWLDVQYDVRGRDPDEWHHRGRHGRDQLQGGLLDLVGAEDGSASTRSCSRGGTSSNRAQATRNARRKL